MNLKRKIEKNFNSASSTYDQEGQIQKKCASHLTLMLRRYYEKFIPNSILDIGTGTGNMVDFLEEYFPNAKYNLNDISNNMIIFCKKKYINRSNFDFYHEDIEKSNLNSHDLITSNMCLQWTNCFKIITKKLYQKSKIFAFSYLLDGTFDGWNDYLSSHGLKGILRNYPNADDFFNFLKTLQPKNHYIDFLDFHLEFDNPISLMRHLKKLGASTAQKDIALSKLLSLVRSGKKLCSLEYKIVFTILENKNESLYHRN